MAADQFSRTLASESIEPIDSSSTVTPIYSIMRKKVERKRDVLHRNGGGAQYEQPELPPSQAARPDPELWDVVIEAVERFNERQDINHSPFAIRIWAQNTGFRIQLIREKCGTLIKQTRLIRFEEATPEDLNHIINSLVRERGVVIDEVR